VILLVGLGNPGPRYADTRHNIGFMLVDRVATRLGNPVFKDKFQGSFATGSLGGENIGLLKPMTFMNESGRSVQAAMQLYKLAHDAIYVAHDELDLPFGDVRLKVGGGDAGHRGIRSISGTIGPAFVRLRLGVGRPPPDFRGDPADFVLQGFSLAERPSIDSIVDRAADALALAATRGIQVAMNATNQRQNR
jgi:PTH1 family peptidyl-tRNA hydrolase